MNVAADKVTQEIKDLGSITSNILCLTDGGSVDVINRNKDAATGLYTPVYVMGDGKVFDGWYAGDTKLTGQAAAGTTYTAHWTDSQYKFPTRWLWRAMFTAAPPLPETLRSLLLRRKRMLLSLSPAANTLRRWQMADESSSRRKISWPPGNITRRSLCAPATVRPTPSM